MNYLVEKVSEYMQQNHMVEEGQKIVVGVSGGADSMGLLFVLSELAEYFHLSLAVVHVNHGLRGKAADGDQSYVEQVCREQKIPCYSFHVDLKRFAKKEGMSEEEAGRYYRYQCFEKVRREISAQRIAVAHQREDVCETVLFNLFRGTGLRGLSGIPPVRDVIIRPLLCAGRQEIEAYRQERGIGWRTDETNLTDLYARNRIRHAILPYAREYINAAAGQHIQETAGLLKDIADYLDRQGEAAFDLCAEVGRQASVTIHHETFLTFDIVIQREVIRRAISVAAGQLKDVDREHIEMIRALMDKYVGRRCHLPGQLQAVRTYDGIIIKKENASAETVKEAFCMDVRAPGKFVIPGPGMEIELSHREDYENEEIPINRYTKWFDYDRIKNGLTVRTRENGDFITLDGQGHRKLLKRWMIDEKIPREQRESMLLLADGNHILWIMGYRISDNYKVTDATKRVVVVRIKGEKSDGGQYQNIVDRGRSRYPDSRTG